MLNELFIFIVVMIGAGVFTCFCAILLIVAFLRDWKTEDDKIYSILMLLFTMSVAGYWFFLIVLAILIT